MIAEFDGSDYLLVLEEGELHSLVESPLKTTLTTVEGKTEKPVVLAYGQTKEVGGIELSYQREGTGFGGIKEIRVEINHWVYSHISRRGRFSARNGSQVVEIQDGRFLRRPII